MAVIAKVKKKWGLAPGVRVVYASTRQIYGAPRYLPLS